MKKLKKKNLVTFFSGFILFALLAAPVTSTAQEKMKTGDLENLQDENMEYMRQIYMIVDDYPEFSYTYTIDDGEVDAVVVEGVDNTDDRERLEVLLLDLKSNKETLKSQANRTGVFYSVDKEASFTGGQAELEDQVLDNIEYPEDAEDWGAEGTVFVQFVIDENGEIPFVTASENFETSIGRYIENFEEQAIDAVKATSGNWEPAEVDGEEVASLAILPVTFKLDENPVIHPRFY